MACEIQMFKMQGGLRPAQQSDMDSLEKVRTGAPVLAKIIQMRNPKFHAKFFAMLNFAFEYFQPEIHTTKSGIVPERNFDKFREDVTILAGFYDVVVNIKGEARYQAKSISFGSMEDLEFQDVYKAVFNVCWRMVLSKVNGMTEQVAENVINSMMSFD
jgi:hypothetical protein